MSSPDDVTVVGSTVTTIRVEITGRVQGVWYRGWTVQEAKRLGLNGWVRNRTNGCVEAVFSGSAAAVDEMLAACWNGPTSATVKDVIHTSAKAPATHGFSQQPTA